MRANERRTTRADLGTRMLLDPGNVWRIGLVVIALIALVMVVRFVLEQGSSLIFTVVMAWFASLAMEPAVSRLARHMPRGAATGVVMAGVVAFLVLFFALFGGLIVEQVTALVESVPSLARDGLAWVNGRLGTDYTLDDVLANIDLSPERAAGVAGQLAGGVLVVLGSIAGAVATFFVFALLLFYLSADGPRLRRWIASLFPTRVQETTVVVWDTTAEKTGRYVSARVILAAVNATASGVVFLVIGLPSWLALALWTGLVAQFVPAIGTYISIVLPVLVGLLSPNPWLGVMVLAWGVVYQQVENLTIEPRISARAVNVHPAVSFGSVILGTAMFGIAGALLAIPVVAMLLSLLDLYRTRYELLPELSLEDDDAPAEKPVASDESRGATALPPVG
ncbi:AI-2E family transporter [Cellulomonas aerilata]|uniref:AI-2E family transporter n=1 Tax=Cellulomonas aerilata TaxID=515326 RepID=A0A512DB91_9CELL|nr:AI-2E family transporter [Cellulomonas aerilata]GEO33751.1 AI-2E family transporter [Cellulomonas aerilata]